jgi:hypothetical protein
MKKLQSRTLRNQAVDGSVLRYGHGRTRMDIREASAMTEASGLTNDQEKIERGAGAVPGTSKKAAAGFSDKLRRTVSETPLQSLFIAFLLGIIAGRRR